MSPINKLSGGRHKAERDEAARLGITVSNVERDLPEFTRGNLSCKLVRGLCVKYSLPRYGEGKRSIWSLLQRTERDGAQLPNGYLLQGEVSENLRRALQNVAAEFSEEYYEFEGTATEVSVYWEEYGGAAQVRNIHKVLRRLAGPEEQMAVVTQPSAAAPQATGHPVRTLGLLLSFFFFAFAIFMYLRCDYLERQWESKMQSIHAGKVPPETLTVLNKYLTYQHDGRGYPHVVFRTSKDTNVVCVTTHDFYDSIHAGSTATAYYFPDGYLIPEGQGNEIGFVKWFCLWFGVVLGLVMVVFAFVVGRRRFPGGILFQVHFQPRAERDSAGDDEDKTNTA